MYLHLGQNTIVHESEILGIFDLDITSQSYRTRQYLNRAERNGEVAGYAFCVRKQFVNDNNMTDVRTLYIDDLCVDENVRGLHIGRSLYDYVIDYARGHGYYNVTLNVWADNVSAVGFYEKIGLRVQKIGMEKIL